MKNSLLFSLLLAMTSLASDVDSGPKVGEKVPALKVYDATGTNKDKTVDYAAIRKGALTVYLLVDAEKFDRPMHRFFKGLDEKLGADFEGSYAVAVWLTDDVAASKKRVNAIQSSVNYGNVALTVFKGKEGPKGWNANSDAHLTVIVANKGKVAARFGYRSVNGEDVAKVVKELKKLSKKK